MAAQPQGIEQAPRFSSPQEEALLTLMRASDSFHRAMQQRLKPAGLTATQYNALRILRGARPSGLTCSAIGSRMITAEPDITRLLNRLKTQKLLCQQRDAQDRRVVWTHITEKGLELLARLDPIIDPAPRELLTGLTCAEILELTRLLKKAQETTPNQAQRNAETEVTAMPPSPGFPRRHPLG